MYDLPIRRYTKVRILALKGQTVTRRNTVQRASVYNAVHSSHNHPTAIEVLECVRKQKPDISLATVYRNLELLVEQGEIRKIDMPDGAAHYDGTLSPHYHLHCRNCNKAFDVWIPEVQKMLEAQTSKSEFVIEGHDVVFEGLCTSCKESL